MRRTKIADLLVESFNEHLLGRGSVFFRRTGYILGITVGAAGVFLAVLYPWPSLWIAEEFSLSLIAARLILALSLSVTICIVIVGILLMPRRASAPPSAVVVSEDVVYSWLLETLTAFQKTFAARFRELNAEHELTRKNRRYHQEQVRKLIEMGLLDCEAPWLRYSGSAPEWRSHLIERKEIDRELREINNILCKRFNSPKYSIALATRQAKSLIEHVMKALKKLREDKEKLSLTG